MVTARNGSLEECQGKLDAWANSQERPVGEA